ncbi:hypothetical protein [Gelidibacter maritimus]|uniref:Phosphoribosylpyrophosphate synthetase n=1 Tax=Gelidibacter maritimus TaxID=2761487 RepID=A0A7W2R2B1_9FLAO|nr:hypothetical protein [Gelidibacter maritimus]MBA6151423.1 hypothetical protein [Gelidibacter maritimus]
MKENSKNELDYIRRYEAAGFTDQFQIVDDQLQNIKSKNKYNPQDVTILKEHRYEGMTNPSDMSLLYVIETTDGSKGTLLASYGANADNSIHNFMNLIPEDNVRDDFMLPPDHKD